ncbi:nuclear transport factor 2 family protein [Muriicola sp. Z0-33]|uniref:nuclear transport factor 2 family protein n=1 Tax=Muriicola sp. Z0-33 TaxID=2816957 RepID=UPI00223886F2|nr:nuclear transport factor 2 family protein [Muriicola sp. Z0-33]MCW5514760.1 nuclear transport factor 2 family protein [Muriicola sp. Z0-33]
MKKLLLLALLLVFTVAQAQKKKNGTIYQDHPTIEIANDMMAAFVAGDETKVASYLADDFKAYNGTSTNKNNTGRTKEQYLNNVKWWKNNIAYGSISASPGAYPDALEYKDGQIWVQTWSQYKGVHNETGVKIDMPFHQLMEFNADNKIKTLINYTNQNVWREIGRSYGDRENGKLYDHHDYINKVRRMMSAFENNDLEMAYSYFDEKCRFNSLESPVGETMTLDELKERNKGVMEAFDITSIDVVGYPDYLEYDLGDGQTVQSWWNFRMTRKSDGKKIVMPALYIHDFNDEGKIVRSNAYISTKIMDAK